LPFLCVRHLRSEQYTKGNVLLLCVRGELWWRRSVSCCMFAFSVCAASQIRAIHEKGCLLLCVHSELWWHRSILCCMSCVSCVCGISDQSNTQKGMSFYCVCAVSFGDTETYRVACPVVLVCAASQIRAIHERECSFIVCVRWALVTQEHIVLHVLCLLCVQGRVPDQSNAQRGEDGASLEALGDAVYDLPRTISTAHRYFAHRYFAHRYCTAHRKFALRNCT